MYDRTSDTTQSDQLKQLLNALWKLEKVDVRSCVGLDPDKAFSERVKQLVHDVGLDASHGLNLVSA
jgi:hypothetical protein